MQGAGEFNPKEFDGETRFRSYALRTSQTIKKIINIVPTTPYPSIVASSDSKIVGFRIPVASSLNHMSRGICPIRHIIRIIRGVLPGKALSDMKQRQDPPLRNIVQGRPFALRRNGAPGKSRAKETADSSSDPRRIVAGMTVRGGRTKAKRGAKINTDITPKSFVATPPGRRPRRPPL